MKNYSLTLVLLFTMSILSFGQNDARLATGIQALEELPRMTMPALDNEALYETELARRAPGVAPRFAENIEVNVTPSTHGVWETADNGNKVWRHRIYSAGAKSLNLGFTKFFMPEGGTLILYGTEKSNIMGPFTPADNEEHEQLWTPILEGDEIIIEVQVPAAVQNELELELKSVNHDYVGFAEMSVISGSCNLDVICSAVDGWEIVDGYRDIIRSVAVISTGGGTFCTGFLVNNVNNDCAPFFMTANHCGINSGNAASLVTYWNFENSTCRQPNSPESGQNGDGQLNDFNTGAIHRASWAASDMTLVEMDDPISETANAFFAGWSAEFVMPQDTIIAIHHPSTDEKRISFEFDPSQPGMGLNSNVVDISVATHVIIPDWDIGTTEPGSSGSPLYNNQKQVVGQLHGGAAACGNNSYDTYGWFHTSWEGGGTPATALKFWLDPNDTGITNIAGKDCSFNVAIDPPFQEICAPDDAVFNMTVAENFASDVTLTANNVPAGATATFSVNPVPPNGTTVLTISNTAAVASGQYQIEVFGTDGADDATSIITLSILEGAPMELNQLTPADGEVGVITAPMFTWDASPGGGTYSIEIADDAAFANIIQSATGLTDPSFNGNFLEVLTTYYWRIKADNLCGEGPWTAGWSFTTADISCGNILSTDVPIAIEEQGTPTVTSEIEINTTGLVTDINVNNLDITHSWVGDLSATLQAPSGLTIQLFNEPGGGDCDESNMLVSFDDSAAGTSAEFEASCNGGGLAISGDFQPAEALAGFIGQDPNGTWTLIVADGAGGDGGSINNWEIELCTAIPVDLSLSPSTTELQGCIGGDYALDLTIGGAFDPAGATLTVSGNPAGSTVTFSDNPAMPGSMVDVDITGIMNTGTYTLTFNANDGTNSTDAIVTLVIGDVPAASGLISPADAASNIGLSPTLEWMAATSASSYDVELATDAGFTNIVASTSTTLLTYPVPLALEFGTEYFWRVNAVGNCGETMSVTNSFTTVPNLTVTVSPAAQTACASEEVTFEVMVGDGFAAPAMINSAIVPNAGVTISYDVDPNDVTPGSVVTVTVSDLDNATPGSYAIEFSITDGANVVVVFANLDIEGAPALASLNSPADGATNQVVQPNLSWTVVSGADSYLVEIATDAAFTNIVEMDNTTTTGYTVSGPLDYLTTYFWRVTAQNDCGGTPTDPFSFTTEMDVAVDELEGNAFSISPNPTDNRVEIVFAQAINKDLTVEVYTIDGKLLQQHNIERSVERIPLELGAYAGGVYVVRLVTAKAAVARRVILKK